MLTIGEKIIAIREAIKIKQKDFAESIEILPQALIKYEKNIVKPSSDILSKIAKKHKININWLIADIGNMFIEEEKKSNTKADEIIEAYKKLPEEKQKYYYFKIIADSLEPITKTEETRENTSVFTN